jgi:hypothetical protein
MSFFVSAASNPGQGNTNALANMYEQPGVPEAAPPSTPLKDAHVLNGVSTKDRKRDSAKKNSEYQSRLKIYAHKDAEKAKNHFAQLDIKPPPGSVKKNKFFGL